MISVIIPTLNEGKHIGAILKNLAPLRGKDFEIIVSDGQSTDRTIEIAQHNADKVLTLSDISTRTIALQRNRGAAASRGEYFAFIDATVLITGPVKFFERALSQFESNKQLVGLTALVKVSPDKATRADRFFFGILNLVHIVMNNFFHIGMGTGKFQMTRRDAFNEIKGYREDLATTEDNDFFYRLSKIGRTRLDTSLTVFHDGRRAHTEGWPRLLFKWGANSFSRLFFNRSSDKEWLRK